MSQASDKFEEAARIMQRNGLEAFSPGGSSREFIEKVEARLGVRLPSSYREFLREYGILEVEAEEFYGEFDDEGFATAIPSFVFATEKARELGDIGSQDIMIRTTGYGPVVIIDCSVRGEDNECPVLLQDAKYDSEENKVVFDRKQIASSFGQYFFDEMKRIVSENSRS